MQYAHENADNSLQRLWWLQPALLFSLVVGGTIMMAAMTSDAGYRLYGAPKYLTAWHVGLAFAAIAAFGLGCQLAQATGRTPRATPRRVQTLVRVAFWMATLLTLLGYAAWL